MNKNAVKPIVLLIIFICAMVVFSMTTNKVNIDLTANMEEATLPVVNFVHNDVVVNELHGYVREMDLLSMRDSVLPIGEDRVLHLNILTFGQNIENVSFEIRSLDGTRLLMEEDHAEIIEAEDKLACEIVLPSLFEEQEEYNMRITLTVDGKNIHYYTRLMRASKCFVDETLAFAMKFHEYTFRDDAATFIPTYMDPATGDPTTLNYVDLTCTLRQITWAKFRGVKLTTPVASFKEISDSFNVITLTYVMTNINEANETEFYNVEEYYRLRQTSTRIYVLNFERRMNQIFRSENDFILGNSAIQLGIRDDAVEFKANDSGDHIAFVQEGALWCYNRSENSMSEVFDFRGIEGVDQRENWDQHDIKIVRVDEAGSIDFIVYGYMNRGKHEGEVGIGVYHYDGIAHTVEEEIFISSDKNYEKLKAELGELMYVNEQKQLFLMMNENIYKVDLNSYHVQCIAENSNGEGYAISESDRYVAWVDADKLYNSSVIHMMDLKTGVITDWSAGTDTYLKPIEFIGEDFVYGIANIADVKMDSVGNTIFPMKSIEILNPSEGKYNIIKTYTPEGRFIGKVSVADMNIHVELLTEVDGRLVVSGADTIMNRETEVKNQIAINKTVSDMKQTQVSITMKTINGTNAVKIITPKHVILDNDKTMSLDLNKEGEMYYVYLKGDILLATSNISEAIITANSRYGVVVDQNQRYIYKRARSTSQSYIKNLVANSADKNASGMAKCISAILEFEEAGLSVNELMQAGQTPYYILNTTLKEELILELSGCGVDELLYYIDQGNPVLAKTGDNDAILLTGYSSTKIYYYDPKTEKTKNMSYEEMDEILYKGGNYFIVYLK
ncbi:MAG: hypothetical protein J6B96_02875 [Agathobacter sp.]|nr:hypothetical protein [Agathobacter sp.]